MYERTLHGTANCIKGRTPIVKERLDGGKKSKKSEPAGDKKAEKVQSPKSCADCGGE